MLMMDIRIFSCCRDVRVFRLQPRGWAMTAAMRPLAGELRGAPPGVELEVGGDRCL